MKFTSKLLQKVALPKTHTISLQEAQDRGYFGPVYHGTTQSNLDNIDKEGFKVFEGEKGDSSVSNGYDAFEYTNQFPRVPPPVHHLGFGVYFSTNKNIAKKTFNGYGVRMKTYYLDIPNYETINFAAPNTMMKWWVKNGYDPQLAKTDRVSATRKLTDTLKSKWDAVWFKGKTIYKTLDGDQVCVYDPNRVYEIDPKLSQAGEVGAKVRRKSDGMKGVIVKRDNLEKLLERYPAADSWIKPGAKWGLTVKWQKGGTDPNVQDVDVDFL